MSFFENRDSPLINKCFIQIDKIDERPTDGRPIRKI